MEQYTDTYQAIKKGSPFSLRALFRDWALTGLTYKDRLTGIQKYLKTPRVQFLYIHHSFRDELANFEKLLDRLSRDHTFISYSEAVERVLENRIDKPYISFSSDDGFKNNLLAAEVLNKYKAKACFFINPGLIGESDFKKISGHCKHKLHLPPVEFMNWDDVQQMLAQGHEIGGHTMYHDNMVSMNEAFLKQDTGDTFRILSERCGNTRHFAFPYGRFHHFSEKGRKAVFDAGFASCASAERGCHFNTGTRISPEQLCIRRDHVILDWGMDQIFYFIADNVRKNKSSNTFPYSERV